MDICDRRRMLILLGGAATGLVLSGPATAVAPTAGAFAMWRDPGCGCCLQWARKVETTFGRRLSIVEARDMAAIKRARGVPEDLRSCHTALIHGYTIEGHVPPADIRRLIASADRGVRGLAVPGMPMGSPGMEHGDHREAYEVIAFGPGGRRVFTRHG